MKNVRQITSPAIPRIVIRIVVSLALVLTLGCGYSAKEDSERLQVALRDTSRLPGATADHPHGLITVAHRDATLAIVAMGYTNATTKAMLEGAIRSELRRLSITRVTLLTYVDAEPFESGFTVTEASTVTSKVIQTADED